ncbi:Phox domain-containing protein [Cavenderia fasciculata]|uniref:Phox domain-containing protein n=1 Tax=Cavenderia fasciculata TaxID=261658 RepID=F4PR70_CACFS|nr:Phox domain-containing protein [Cavenderia fasciculata]EGG21270.1 Phox domain-containing protein [Cavenderia fasciculata]|eukprot:XP_004359120.1 Phox domain-containing protein [Cavenderia fasciculata]
MNTVASSESIASSSSIDGEKELRSSFEKLLSSEMSKVALLETENIKLKAELAKISNINLRDELFRLEEANRVLSEKLATETTKNLFLENQLKGTSIASTYSLNGNNHHNTTTSTTPSPATSSATANGAAKKPPATIIKDITVPRKVVEAEKNSSRTYTAYLIEVEVDQKRYKQFVLLQSQFVRMFGEHDTPSLPAKKNGIYFSSDDHTEKRRIGLQEYLKIIVNHPVMSQAPFFLQFVKDDNETSTTTSKSH